VVEEIQFPQQTAELLSVLDERFPGAAQPAEYEGLVIAPDRLVEVATFLRDELGYAYLSCVTGVDYPQPTARFETVYHLFRAQGGPLTLHVRASRDDPVVPSLVSVWPSANVQEREAWDLMGIRFEGHPDLRRISSHGTSGLHNDSSRDVYQTSSLPVLELPPDSSPVTLSLEGTITFGNTMAEGMRRLDKPFRMAYNRRPGKRLFILFTRICAQG